MGLGMALPHLLKKRIVGMTHTHSPHSPLTHVLSPSHSFVHRPSLNHLDLVQTHLIVSYPKRSQAQLAVV